MSASNSPDLPQPTDMIDGSHLSQEMVFGILQAAYMKPEVDGDFVHVMGRLGTPCTIIIDVYISLYSAAFFRTDLESHEKLSIVNKINCTVPMARCSMSEDGSSVDMDYLLPIEEGLTPLQLLNCITRFDIQVNHALDELEDSLDFSL